MSFPQLIFQSGEALSSKIAGMVDKLSEGSLKQLKLGEDQVTGNLKFTLDKKVSHVVMCNVVIIVTLIVTLIITLIITEFG